MLVNAYCVRALSDHAYMVRKPEKMEPSDFWKRLTEAWKIQGLPVTQSGIARELRALGYDVKGQSTTQRWHDGTSLPGKQTLIALADKGHTTLDFLIAGRGIPPHDPKDETLAALMRLWPELDPAAQNHVLEAAQGQAARTQEVRALPDPKSFGRKSA